MSVNLKFILVDDDSFSNMIYGMIIKEALGDVDITTFTEPEEGLEFIKEKYIDSAGHTILFLDINMPTISGWQFLEEFEKFSAEIKKQINVYILSSSLDWRDKDKAEANKNVKGFISKPLDFETVTEIAQKAFQNTHLQDENDLQGSDI